MIPQSFIQDLLNRVDIVDVVGKYVQLKKGGANFMGLCPFHNEKSPSFTVSPAKQFYHCFGCGAHGSAIGFLMEYSGQSYPDAVRELAQSVGLTVPEERDRLPPAQRAEQQAKSLALSDAMTRASEFYRRQLRGAPAAIQYLKGRGLTGEIAAQFGLGYAPDDWQGLEPVFGSYRDDAIAGPLIEAGLLIESEKRDADGKPRRYDRFRDRIMFPIRNTKGQVIGFGGRVMGQGEPKYLNSPETPLFSKGTELYGLFEARHAIRETGYVLVVEGYMDVVALAQLGFANAVATLGTACTPVHVQKLLRQTDAVVFSFDGDAAGRRAARRALEACLPYVADNKTIRFLFLPAEHDPDSYVREEGTEAFAAQVRDAMPLSRFLLQCVTEEQDLRQPEGRARAQYEAKPLLKAMPPGGLRLQIVRELAEATGTTPAEIEAVCGLGSAGASAGAGGAGTARAAAADALSGAVGAARRRCARAAARCRGRRIRGAGPSGRQLRRLAGRGQLRRLQRAAGAVAVRRRLCQCARRGAARGHRRGAGDAGVRRGDRQAAGRAAAARVGAVAVGGRERHGGRGGQDAHALADRGDPPAQAAWLKNGIRPPYRKQVCGQVAEGQHKQGKVRRFWA